MKEYKLPSLSTANEIIEYERSRVSEQDEHPLFAETKPSAVDIEMVRQYPVEKFDRAISSPHPAK